MREAVFLQVRLGSQRLPGKALLPLEGGSVIQHAMRALSRIPVQDHVMCTDEHSASLLEPLARREGFACFVGPAEDVLKRFRLALEAFPAERVIRATGDNPLVSPHLAGILLESHRREGADLSHQIDCPLGTGVEVVEAEALKEADRRSGDPYEREHLTTYLYRRSDEFRVLELPCPEAFYLPAARVTLDTEDDFRLIQRIFADLYRGRVIETEELVGWLRAHPEPSP